MVKNRVGKVFPTRIPDHRTRADRFLFPPVFTFAENL